MSRIVLIFALTLMVAVSLTSASGNGTEHGSSGGEHHHHASHAAAGGHHGESGDSRIYFCWFFLTRCVNIF